jgi:NarL family two-component system response regulator LiaR
MPPAWVKAHRGHVNGVTFGDDPIRVLVVDDYEMIRRGLASMLSQAADIHVVGLASGRDEAVRLARLQRPDVVLMELVMSDGDGVEAIRAIRAAAPASRVLALASLPNDALVMQALEAGAIGYLLKDILAPELHDAIRAARAGRVTLAPPAARVVIKSGTQPPRGVPRGHALSGREMEVLRLMIRGLTNRQIAEELILSRATVNFHVSNILGKLGAEGRTHAVAVALRDRLVA